MPQTVRDFLTNPMSTWVPDAGTNPALLPASHMITGTHPPVPVARQVQLYNSARSIASPLRSIFTTPATAVKGV